MDPIPSSTGEVMSTAGALDRTHTGSQALVAAAAVVTRSTGGGFGRVCFNGALDGGTESEMGCYCYCCSRPPPRSTPPPSSRR
jgi:hypothetical protein